MRKRDIAAMTAALMLHFGCAPPPAEPVAPPAPPEEVLPRIEPSAPAREPLLQPPAMEPIRIALLLPLSGPMSDVGAALADAAALALFDAYDPRLELIPFDTRGTPEGARQAAETALSAGARVVLGPLLADSVAAAAPVLEESGAPVIGFSNDRRVAAPGIYLMGFMPDQEVARIISYAARRGHRRFAALIPQSAYGERLMQSFGPAVLATGSEVVALGRYEQDPDRLAEPVRRIARYDERRAAYEAEVEALRALGDDMSREILRELETKETIGEVGFDAILVAEGDPLLRSLAPLLPFYEVDPANVRFLGTGLWDDPALTREPPLRGGWFPAPEPERPRAFLARLERISGREPPRIATLAYDAMALVATLARNPVAEDRFSAEALTDPAGFVGLDGPFRFRPDGIAERRLAVLSIARGGFEIVDAAPAGFEPERLGVLRGPRLARAPEE